MGDSRNEEAVDINGCRDAGFRRVGMPVLELSVARSGVSVLPAAGGNLSDHLPAVQSLRPLLGRSGGRGARSGNHLRALVMIGRRGQT